MKKYLIVLLLTGGVACQSGYHLANRSAKNMGVDSLVARSDSSVAAFLTPYRQGVDRTMNEVLAQSTGRIEKGLPEAPLNDLLTDILLKQSALKYGKAIDCAHLNYGGIRANLPAGHITTGDVFEVMPFDNQLVVLTLTGDMLQQLLDHFAGGLVESGLRVTLHNKHVLSATLVNGQPIQPDKNYTVVMSDYIANGGDNANFLAKAVKRENLNYLMRDALLDYFRQQGKAGQPVTPTTDGRVSSQ